MPKNLLKALNGVKDATVNVKDKVVAGATEILDANGDGTVDIVDIIILAVQMPGIHIRRDRFLRKELSKNHPTYVVEDAIARTPALAGIPSKEIDKIADEVIKFERNCVSGISAALGMPGGAAIAATLPADIVQYYAYTLRAVQELLYLYGFPEIDIDEEGLFIDAETTNRIIACLGVMYGVAGANNAIKVMAQALSKGVEKKLLQMALTKGAFYPFIKSTLKWFGINLTKQIFAKAVKNAIPVAGGVVGGGITFLSFKPCCLRLKNALADTYLSNMNHISSAEEEDLYSKITHGEIYEGEFEDCEEGAEEDTNEDVEKDIDEDDENGDERTIGENSENDDGENIDEN